MCKQIASGSLLYSWHGELSSGLCADLEGWDSAVGVLTRSDDICIHMADSRGGIGETNTAS